MKPSKITTVKAKKAWYLPPKIRALTWMGIVYCKHREVVGWKELEKLTLKEKRELAKEYYNSRKKG